MAKVRRKKRRTELARGTRGMERDARLDAGMRQGHRTKPGVPGFPTAAPESVPGQRQCRSPRPLLELAHALAHALALLRTRDLLSSDGQGQGQGQGQGKLDENP